MLPVKVKVYDFVLPDRLSFWPELNAYQVPRNTHDFYRLAHQNRCLLNCWKFRPQTRGAGKDIKVDWKRYDKLVGPLLEKETERLNRALRKQVLSKEVLRALQEPLLVTAMAGGLYVALTMWAAPIDTVILLALLFARALSNLNRVQKQYQQMAGAESAYYSLTGTVDRLGNMFARRPGRDHDDAVPQREPWHAWSARGPRSARRPAAERHDVLRRGDRRALRTTHPRQRTHAVRDAVAPAGRADSDRP